MNNNLLAAAMLSVLLLAGCSDTSVLGPDLATETPTSAVKVTPDVSGSWEWSEVTEIKATPIAAFIFGVVPEGPITHLTCPSSGVLTITQNGSTFSGSSTQTPGTCTTRGGQTGQPPFPPTLELVNGNIQGRSFRFSFLVEGPLGEPPMPCNYRGALRVTGGATSAFQGSGSCEVPPELGSDKILHFTAVRP